MKYDKRIWRTAVLAVAITALFAVFVFSVEDWTNGINSDFIVYGQTSNNTTVVPGVTSTNTKVISHMPVGTYDGNVTKYKTVVQITNIGTTAVALTGGIYTAAGAASTQSFVMSGAAITGVTSVTNTNLATGITLPVGQTMVLVAETAPTGSTYATSWMKIIPTGGSIAASAFFELRDGATNLLYSRVGVAGSLADMTKFVIPRVRTTSSGTDVGFALVNTSLTATATITATLKDAAGATVAVKAQALTPGQQIATFPKDFFGLTTEATGTTYHSMIFESSSPTIGATALAVEGASLASFPVEKLQ
jgi:hypothetical protein